MEELMETFLSFLPQVFLGASTERMEEKIDSTVQRTLMIMKIDSGLDMGLFVTNLLSSFITLVFCVGFIRQIYAWKAITLGVHCLIKMVPNIVTHVNEEMDTVKFKTVNQNQRNRT